MCAFHPDILYFKQKFLEEKFSNRLEFRAGEGEIGPLSVA